MRKPSTRSCTAKRTERTRPVSPAVHHGRDSSLRLSRSHDTSMSCVLNSDRPHPDPRLLCVFCSELLPALPSAKLLALIARLKPLGRAAPTTYNKYAVSLSMSQSINVCTLHRSETSHLPSALKNGWPTEIDWEDAQRRVRKPAMLKELDKIVLAKESSVFYGFAREQAEKVGSVMARTAKGQFEVATKSQPG